MNNILFVFFSARFNIFWQLFLNIAPPPYFDTPALDLGNNEEKEGIEDVPEKDQDAQEKKEDQDQDKDNTTAEETQENQNSSTSKL